MKTHKLIYLDDYLKGKDFQQALNKLAVSFRAKVQLDNPINELGVVCPDVIQAVDYLREKYNMKPFMIGEGPPRKFIQDGIEKKYTTRVAFGVYQGVLIELAEPGTGSNIFATHLDKNEGRIIIHHMGFRVKGKNLRKYKRDYLEIMKAEGYEPWTEADIVLLGAKISVSIFKTDDETGGISTELIRFRFLGIELPFLLNFSTKLIARIQDWFGPKIIKIT